ncbi:MAG: glycosyltransferase [Syntrophobacteraceae bacterium]
MRGLFDYKTITIKNTLKGEISRLARLAEGDIIYACKPLITSFLPALVASRLGFSRPLLLDIEDDELWVPDPGGNVTNAERLWKLRRTYALHPFTRFARFKTVVSRRLKKRYGGEIVLHGPDEKRYDPGLYGNNIEELKRCFGLPATDPCVLFAGIPHMHKGLDTLARALRDPRLDRMHLVLAGPEDHPTFLCMKKTLGDRATLLGMVPQSDMPRLLAAIDIVPTPQIDNDFTQAQIPAKLLEGMAMGKACIASRVSDLPIILGENTPVSRGWLHEPGDSAGLTEALLSIMQNPREAKRRSEAARTFFLEEASISAIRRKVAPIVERASRGINRPDDGKIFHFFGSSNQGMEMATTARKLNLGCGFRYRDDESWENVDYPGSPPKVKRADLRNGVPYPDNAFDFIYTSHVLDHFTLDRADFLVREMLRCLNSGGVCRISVPDLEFNCRRYLESVAENSDNPERHLWFTIELLDQMTRTESGGEKARFLRRARQNPVVREWLKPLLGHEMLSLLNVPDAKPLRGVRLLKRKIASLVLSRSFEKSGEKHFWTFDRISLRDMFRRAGFVDIVRQDCRKSMYAPYESENLDMQDGREYKPGSLYVEGRKP